ncbi:hypothetical protein LCGC14_0582120 [marine sediment metagenome]|uniref:Uncharacterized protein n=1 Tax=marine sediment metagenome TaxID=412755 RepID=A0A0F9RZR0_9ZZZZ
MGNKARKKITDRAKYLRNRDTYVTRSRAYRATTHGRAVEMWHSHRRTAKVRGLDATLTKEWIEEKLNGVCEATGLGFELTGGRGPKSPSLDRMDSSKGYTPENTRMVLWAINLACGDWGQEVFLPIANEWIVETYG